MRRPPGPGHGGRLIHESVGNSVTASDLEFELPRLRVLIVDDTPTICFFLTHLLEAAGHETQQAENGWEALRQFIEWQPDLILMDSCMPEMDGFEAMQRIRSTPGGTAVKIISMSATTGHDDPVVALASGADDFICKPFSRAQLFEKIDRLWEPHALDAVASPMSPAVV